MWVKEEEKATLKCHKIWPGLHCNSLLIFTKTCICHSLYSSLVNSYTVLKWCLSRFCFRLLLRLVWMRDVKDNKMIAWQFCAIHFKLRDDKERLTQNKLTTIQTYSQKFTNSLKYLWLNSYGGGLSSRGFWFLSRGLHFYLIICLFYFIYFTLLLEVSYYFICFVHINPILIFRKEMPFQKPKMFSCTYVLELNWQLFTQMWRHREMCLPAWSIAQ